MDYVARHELLDRAYLACDFVDGKLVDHPAFEDLSALQQGYANAALEALAALYASLGHDEAQEDLAS